jgi:hypothetical protein
MSEINFHYRLGDFSRSGKLGGGDFLSKKEKQCKRIGASKNKKNCQSLLSPASNKNHPAASTEKFNIFRNYAVRFSERPRRVPRVLIRKIARIVLSPFG